MKRVIIIMLSFLALGAQAQTQGDTLKMTLQDCIDYALKNNVDVKNATLDEAIAKSKVGETRGIGLPQINGSVGLQHYFKLRNFYLPKSSLLNFTPPDQQGALAALPDNTIGVVPNLFQLPTTLDASITASQLLFSASYIIGLQAANTYKELSRKSTAQTKETTVNNVKKAYYSQLIALERIKLFDANIARLDTIIRQTTALQKSGFAESIDVDRLTVSYNNLLTEFEKTLSLLALASLQLKFQMGMPLEQNLILNDRIETVTVDTSYRTNQQIVYNNRSEYELLQVQRKLNTLELRNYRSAALPSLLLRGSLGAFTSQNNLNFFEEKSFLVDNTVKRRNTYWSDYSFIELGLNVPIFSGLQNNYKVQQSKLSLQKTENNIRNFESAMSLQVKASRVNLDNAYRSLDIQRRNVELAKKVSNVSLKKYKAGTGSNLEVTEAESSLKEAQINYFNALYDYMVNKIEYEHAIGANKY